MGWWRQDKDENSFVEDSEMIWGDGPADTIGDAIEAVIAEFIADVGRRPTRNEIHPGINFCLGGLDDYWDRDLAQWK